MVVPHGALCTRIFLSVHVSTHVSGAEMGYDREGRKAGGLFSGGRSVIWDVTSM